MSRVLRWLAVVGGMFLALLAALTRRDRATAARAVAEDRAEAAHEAQGRVAEGQAAAQDARQLQAEGRGPEAGMASRDAAWGRK